MLGAFRTRGGWKIGQNQLEEELSELSRPSALKSSDERMCEKDFLEFRELDFYERLQEDGSFQNCVSTRPIMSTESQKEEDVKEDDENVDGHDEDGNEVEDNHPESNDDQ